MQVLEQDDLTIANLECVLSNETDKAEKYDYGNNYWFNGRPEYANILRAGSIEAVSLANNHTYDYGQKGFDATCRALDEVGVKHFGYSSTAVYMVKGIEIGLAGFNQLGEYEQGRDMDELRQEVENVTREIAGKLIRNCVFPLGNEYHYKVDPIQTELASRHRLGGRPGLGAIPMYCSPSRYTTTGISYTALQLLFRREQKADGF